MNTHDIIRENAPQDVVELGLASVETKGMREGLEFVGEDIGAGISEE